jgi:hypothetical protein
MFLYAAGSTVKILLVLRLKLCIYSQVLMRAACHTHPTLFDFIILIICKKEYKLWTSALCSFLLTPITSSLDLNIIFSNLFSETLNHESSLNVTDRVSHPYETTGKIIISNILIYAFVVRISEAKKF